MARILLVATTGAGGDLPPVLAAALALRDRGHELLCVGDEAAARALSKLGVEARGLPAHLDLGPLLSDATRRAMEQTGGDPAAAGPLVEQTLATWAVDVAVPVSAAASDARPDAVITSLFGVEVALHASLPCPVVVVNSTFYIGPRPPRPLADDCAPRALPLLSRYAELLDHVDVVLHATDREFDLCFDPPPGHHYVGPLGIWEQSAPAPGYVSEPGPAWILVAISSQLQDDLAIADAAAKALDGLPFRGLVTVGPDHARDELTHTPSNVRVEQVVSHAAVLADAALLVNHAGHGSVMKAMWHGVPMVLVPWGRDQPGVAYRAARLGVASMIDRGDLSATTLRQAIVGAVEDDAMKGRAVEVAERLRRTDPAGRAAELIEECL